MRRKDWALLERGQRLILLASLVCGACRTAAPRGTAIAAAPAGSPPPAATARKPAPAPARELPWMATVKAELEALRGLKFRSPVAFEEQGREAFRRQVRAEIAEELPPTKSTDLSRAYVSLGFIQPGVNLAAAFEEAMSTQVAAYYDPKLKIFRVLDADKTPKPTAENLRVVSHELTHALQDQHFDLRAFHRTRPPGSAAPEGEEDEELARRFVTEGEATFLMMARDLARGKGAGFALGPLSVAGLRMSITMLAATDPVQLWAMLRRGGSSTFDEQTNADLIALENLPPMVSTPMIEPYNKGALFVSEVWAAGGWAAVDALYRSPPESTEQVLHPKEKFLEHRDPPLRIAGLPAPPAPAAEARLLATEVVGELGWRTYLRVWKHPTPETGAAGWGGDRFWAWALGARTVAVTATAWDSDAEAQRFADAYEGTLAVRLPRAAVAGDGTGGIRIVQPDGTLVAVERRGRRVDIVEGAQVSELEKIRGSLRAARFEAAR